MLTQQQIDDLLNASREAAEGPTALVRRIEAAAIEHMHASYCQSQQSFVDAAAENERLRAALKYVEGWDVHGIEVRRQYDRDFGGGAWRKLFRA